MTTGDNLEAAGDVIWRFDQGCTRLAFEGHSRHDQRRSARA
jgi:hypothetical protein